MINWLMITGIIALLLAAYGVWMQFNYTRDKGYKSMLDASAMVQCKKSLSNGMPSTYIGFVVYATILLLIVLGIINWVHYISIALMIGSIYGAWKQYFKDKVACILCTSLYMVNIALLLLS